MSEKQTVIDQIEITRRGDVQLRLGLLLVEDGNEIDSKNHRTIIPFGQGVGEQIAAVNQHLVAMGYPPVSERDVRRVVAHIATDQKFRSN